tara:strand:+ start:2604 stop:3293 length:690 start_codon:yes stop_codon:yes gene_type:complete
MNVKLAAVKIAKLLVLAGFGSLLLACSDPEAVTERSTSAAEQTQVSEQTIKFEQDVHYKLVENIDIEHATPPLLVQYFWFGCQHCQQFEPVLEAIMLRRPELSLVRKHAASVSHWQTDARIFYSLQQMGLEHLTEPLFALYREKRQLTPVDLQQFLTTHQVDQKMFFDIAETSEQVVNKMRQSSSEMQTNGIRGVPALVVNGKYLITPTAEINSLEMYLALIDYLQQKT